MKAKYIKTVFISVLLLFISMQGFAAEYTLNQATGTIAVQNTAYLPGMDEVWYINTGINKPIKFNFTVDLESYNYYDYITIYNVDDYGNLTLLTYLDGTLGMYSGSISSTIPNGKVKVVFHSEYDSYTSDFTGFTMNFTEDNSIAITDNIYVSGKVGIGTTAPQEKLHVNGSVRGNIGSYGALRIKTSVGYIDVGPQSYNCADFKTDRTKFVFNKPVYSATGEFSSANYGANLFLQTYGTTRMTILNSNGNVGIGTITPGFRFHIKGSNANSDQMTLGSTGTGNFALTSNDGNAYGLFAGISGTGRAWLQAGRYDTNTAYDLSLQASGGNVGIGTTAPLAKLHVNSGQNNPYAAILATSSENNNLVVSSLNTSIINGEVFRISQEYFNSPSNRNNGFISFYRGDGVGNGFLAFGSNGLERLRINPSGNISIGTTVTDPTALLTVNGTIHAKEINVTVDIPADYVFKPSYKLMSLHEVEQFVKTNSHLPEIPTAAEITKNGLSVGEMQNKLLQKIEELTLYVIEQQKRIEQLENTQK